MWLGRQDSNLGMAESKSAESINDYNSHSGNEHGSPSNSINGLGFVPERDRPASVAHDLISDDDPDSRLWEWAAIILGAATLGAIDLARGCCRALCQ